jgi:hypothetical protein
VPSLGGRPLEDRAAAPGSPAPSVRRRLGLAGARASEKAGECLHGPQRAQSDASLLAREQPGVHRRNNSFVLQLARSCRR